MVVLVIPAFLRTPRDVAMLARCLGAAAGPEVDRIVVVDDASPLPVPPASPGVEVLRQPANRGPAAARNRGVERALGLGAAVVLFTDHDCVPDPGWGGRLAGALVSGPWAAAGGVTRSLGGTLLDRYHDYAGTLNGWWLKPGHRELYYAPTCNLAVRAEALRTVHFDEHFPDPAGEDVEFCWRLRRAGPIRLHPPAVVRHDFAYGSTLAGLPRFLAMARRYGAAEVLLHERQPELRGLEVEACAAADLLVDPPPADPADWRRNSSGRVRPRRYLPALKLLKSLSMRAYRQGRASRRGASEGPPGPPARSGPASSG